jgi:L-ascorbate metabolism protein UlaG (beta-lactamase superfamily)
MAVLTVLACTGCDERLRRVPAIESPTGSAAALAASDRATDHFATSSGDLAFVPLEHASLLFVWHGLAVYVDPTSPTIDETALPKADVVLVTDAHYDHLDPLALSHLRKAGTVVVGSPAAGARDRLDAPFDAPFDVILHDGESRTLRPGIEAIEVTAVPAYNLARGAGPGMRYHERGRNVGYVLGFGGTRVYVSGDTECTPEMRALPGVDAAVVSLNVPYAMTAAEATECVAAFRPKVAIAYAYRHASPSTLDRAALGPGVDVRRRELYPRAAKTRARAYDAYVHGMWGLADDLLDEAQRLDPEGENDWRVRWTRQWLKEAEKPWPW